MKNIKITAFLLLLCVFASNLCLQAQIKNTVSYERLDSLLDDHFNFIVANDLGRNGYYDQKIIAEQMGELAENTGIEFIAAAGDIHHFEGVASVNDPLWMTNYELIYAHPELMIDWFPILGNHEYRGNTQAVLDYSKVSRRWSMPGRYYAKSFKLDGNATLKLIFIDTTPLIDKYHKEAEESYPMWLLKISIVSSNGSILHSTHPTKPGRSLSVTIPFMPKRRKTKSNAKTCSNGSILCCANTASTFMSAAIFTISSTSNQPIVG